MQSTTRPGVLHHLLTVVEYAAVATEVFAVAIILIGIASATYTFIDRSHRFGRSTAVDRDYRQNLGRTLLLGLEILVAADVVRTVALDPTIESTAVLGLLILIRTFLSWSLVVEIENRWPWQSTAQRVGRLELADEQDGPNPSSQQPPRPEHQSVIPVTTHSDTTFGADDTNEIGRPQ